MIIIKRNIFDLIKKIEDRLKDDFPQETITKVQCKTCDLVGGYCGNCDGSHWRQ